MISFTRSITLCVTAFLLVCGSLFALSQGDHFVSVTASANAQNEVRIFLPFLSRDTTVSLGNDLASISMGPSAPTAVPGLENTFAIAYDYLWVEDDADILFAVFTGQQGATFLNKAYVIRVPHDVSWLGAQLYPLELANLLSGKRKETVRIVSSLKTETAGDGWAILTAMLNKSPRNDTERSGDSSLFLGEFSRLDAESALRGESVTFDFGAESPLIQNVGMVLVGHTPNAQMAEQRDHYVLKACAGRDVRETFDHCSGYHYFLIPKSSPLALETHQLVMKRNDDGALDLLDDPWGSDYLIAWDLANHSTDNPDGGWFVAEQGTETELSGKPDVHQGGAIFYEPARGGSPVLLTLNSKGVARFHKELRGETGKDEVQRRPALFAVASAGIWRQAVNAGEVYVHESYGAGDFSPGWMAIPYLHPLKDASKNITGYRVLILSSRDYQLHWSEANIVYGY